MWDGGWGGTMAKIITFYVDAKGLNIHSSKNMFVCIQQMAEWRSMSSMWTQRVFACFGIHSSKNMFVFISYEEWMAGGVWGGWVGGGGSHGQDNNIRCGGKGLLHSFK